jgi:hypothetical protein
MKIAIGIPITNRLVDKDFFLSFAAMEKPAHYTLLAPSHEIYSHAQDIADIRNDLVKQAAVAGADALIMMDSDQVYPENTIPQIIIGLSKYDAVGAVVHRRYPPFNPLLLRGTLGRYEKISDAECYSGDLIEIDATGCGCIGYNLHVFEDIKPPWYELIPGTNGKPVGEDIRFCHKMRQAGFTIAADTSIQVDHLTTFRVDRATHELFKLIKGEKNGNLQKRQRL